MANNHISKLTVTGLRGISQKIELELSKPLTLIYGENGSGKTSICDAVDFIGNSVVGSLSDVSVGGQRHTHWPFLGRPATDIHVNIELRDGQNWQATTTGRNIDVTNSASKPTVKVWRRKQLIDLILATPNNRFEVIKPFIDLSEIDNSESKLRELKRLLDDQINNSADRISENIHHISRIRKGEGSAADNDVAWATKQLSIEEEEVDDEITALDNLIECITTVVASIDSIRTRSQAQDTATNTEEQAQKLYNDAKKEFDETVEKTFDVLTAAQAFFHAHDDIEACPVCQSKEYMQGLGESIDQKLNSLSVFQQANNELIQAKKIAQAIAARLTEATDSASDNFLVFAQSLNQIDDFPVSNEIVADLLQINSIEDCDTVNMGDIITALRARKSTLQEAKGARDALQSALEIYDENMSLHEKSNAIRPIVKRLLEVHEEKRRDFVDGILTSIAEEVGRLYEEIHPGEGLNRIALKLDPRRRASLEINSEFLEQSVPPGAYFSNSHLDSLGLCILIALAKLENPENTVLVLDDVIGSMDEPHVDRLVELLYAESDNFLHTLVSTHYQAWHFKIRRGQLRNADCQLIELGPWDSTSGVTLRENGRSLLRILEQCIDEHPNEPEPIAANAGHLLEQLGDFLISLYSCSVPKRITGNTLNDYLDALKPRFIQHLKVNIKQDDETYVEVQLQPIIDEIKEIYQVRNTTGAHYNELANHMPVADIVRFGELVVELGNALICTNSGFPNKQKNGDYWATAGETRQLHPLVKP